MTERERDEVDESEVHPGDARLTAADVAHFQARLLALREHMITRRHAHLAPALVGDGNDSDDFDRATTTEQNLLSLRFAEEDRSVLVEIDAALARIEEGSFGVCEGSGNPIGRARLEARPWARNSVEFEEEAEKREKQRHRYG